MIHMNKPQTIADLKPAPYNPRVITDEAAAGLKFAMHEFGDLSGITFNVQTGNLVCGHQRVKQLPPETALAEHRAATDDTGTVGYAEAHIGGSVWPVRLVDWPLAKEKAGNVAANAETITGDFTADAGAIIVEISGVVDASVVRHAERCSTISQRLSGA